MASARARQVWMVDQIDLQSDDRVLELGHGHGVAASAICERLGRHGRYVGVDRSETMTAAAESRLAQHLGSGRARLVTASVADMRLPDAFDVAVAIHFPPIERGDPQRELASVIRHLDPDGRLCVGFQPVSPEDVDRTVDRLEEVLPEHGFTVADVRRGTPDGRPAAVVIATRDRRSASHA